MSENYRKPRISLMVGAICEQYHLDPAEMQTFLFHNFPELKDKTKCANCQASMFEYPCILSYATSELLCEMQAIVYTKSQSKPFTEANQVHRREIRSGYTVASQFTIAAKLGLIAKIKIKNTEGKMVHDRNKGWCITSRGFDFLSNKPVPAKVMVFRQEITEHPEEMITMTEIYKHEFKKVEDILLISKDLDRKIHNPSLL